MLTKKQVAMVAQSDEIADRDRVWCAVSILAKGSPGMAVKADHLAVYLDWPVSRAELAIAAAVEVGLLGNRKTRDEGRPQLIKPEDYTMHLVSHD